MANDGRRHEFEDVNLPGLYESILQVQKAMDLFFENKFSVALDQLVPWAHASIYHALGKGAMCFMQAILTMEVDKIEKAAEVMRETLETCNRRRKRLTMHNMLRGPDYNLYTEEEVHAELCRAESLLLTGVLTFLGDQNLVSFFRGSLRIRSAHNSYKICARILKSRMWESEFLKNQFKSGVKMGVGIFNLVVSRLPTKVLKLLEFIGFSGNKDLGLGDLDAGYKITESLRSPLCALVLASYHTLVAYVFGSGDGDVDYAERILTEMLARYPEAAIFIFLSGRVKQLRGQIEEAIESYKLSINVQEEWRQLHYLCYWELLLCNCFKCDWQQASEFSDLLSKKCKWFPAIYYYVHASVLYMLYIEGSSVDPKDQSDLRVSIIGNMRKVTGLKQCIAGKSIPLESYVVQKAQRFFSQNCYLLLPVFEFMYIWNSFPMIANMPDLIEGILSKVEKIFCDQVETKGRETASLDDYCLVLSLRGVCFRYLDRQRLADECMQEIITCEKGIKQDKYLVPFAMTELACIKLADGHEIEAKELLEAAMHNYHGYPLETMLHFRAHSILKQLHTNSSKPPSPSWISLNSPRSSF